MDITSHQPYHIYCRFIHVEDEIRYGSELLELIEQCDEIADLNMSYE